jgi:hypothetical protein
MCDGCDAWREDLAAPTPTAWAAATARARAAIDDGTLELVDGPPLDDAPPRGHRKHLLQCATCGQLFVLEAGGGHVLGDGWRPLHGN